MAKKILYFIAGHVATVGEAADIAKLEGAAEKPYDVFIRSNKGGLASYGEGRLEPTDFVAGEVPEEYIEAVDEDDERIYPDIDPDDVPVVVPDGSSVVENGASVMVRTSNGSDVELATAEVDGNDLVAVNLPGEIDTVEDGDVLAEAGGGTIAVAVTDGVAVYTYTPGE